MNNTKSVKIIKRNGTKVDFDASKIERAIGRANGDVVADDMISKERIHLIADEVREFIGNRDVASSDEIQDCVETKLLELGSLNLARSYMTYRYKRIIAGRLQNTMAGRLKTLFCKLAAWI